MKLKTWKKLLKFIFILIGVIVLIFLGIFIYKIYLINHYKPNVYFDNSSNMVHDLSFNKWWSKHQNEYAVYDINKSLFMEFPQITGIKKGLFIIVKKINSSEIKVGDIVTYQYEQLIPWATRIMRIYNESGNLYIDAKGDNNPYPIAPMEKHIPVNTIIGKIEVI